MIIRLSFVHQSNNRAIACKRSSQHGLQQTVWCDLHNDCVVGYMLQSFLEQHRTDHIVDVVFSRRVASQIRPPSRLWYRRTDPAFRTWTILKNHLYAVYIKNASDKQSLTTCWSGSRVLIFGLTRVSFIVDYLWWPTSAKVV